MIDNFDERVKDRKRPAPDFPAVTVGENQTSCGLLKSLREALDYPDHVKFLFNDPKLAIVPCDGEEDNAYVVNNGSVAIGWLGTEWGWQPDPGRYRATVDDGVAIVDFSADPLGADA